MFVALPPLLHTILLYPMVIDWFKSLTWVRRLRGQKHDRSGSLDRIHLASAGAPPAGYDVDEDWKTEITTADYQSIFKDDPEDSGRRHSKLRHSRIPSLIQ